MRLKVKDCVKLFENSTVISVILDAFIKYSMKSREIVIISQPRQSYRLESRSGRNVTDKCNGETGETERTRKVKGEKFDGKVAG